MEYFDYHWINELKSIHTFNVAANVITKVDHDELQRGTELVTPFLQVIPSEIIPHLYLGSKEASLKVGLRHCNISAVLSIGAEAMYQSKKVNYLYFSCEDKPDENITKYFDSFTSVKTQGARFVF